MSADARLTGTGPFCVPVLSRAPPRDQCKRHNEDYSEEQYHRKHRTGMGQELSHT